MTRFIKPLVKSVHGFHFMDKDSDQDYGNVYKYNEKVINHELLINTSIIGFCIPFSDSQAIIYSKNYVHHDGGNDYFDGTFWIVEHDIGTLTKMIEDASNAN